MLDKITVIARSHWYWLALIAIGLTAECVALYYQYALDIRPCVLCIHVRIWWMLLIIVAIPALWVTESKKLLITAHLLITTIMGGMLERSYQLLGTERGWIFGSCDFELGLPAWLDLQNWWPFMFKIWESCGYTPELLFGITMAEALLVMSATMLLVSLSLAVATLLNKK